nr:ABC transporter permease [Kibdelosporangium sp. MJ126-NF4]CEL13659.1 putative transmembrane transport protein [Kibdelosporangium sp. MJ126-NF4]CTQ99345.1 putative transmembrane transport protein [Kibdelosporangium sp. MJ126-NF4]
MIWVTWRQQRAQILSVFGVVVVVSAVLVFIRSDVMSLLPDKGLISDRYNMFLQYFQLVMLAVPPLLGAFFGAPLVAREVEQGTHVFGLTQSVSRARWLATKLVMAGGSIALAMFTLGLVTTWALAPMNFVMRGRIVPPLFEIQGVVVGAYALLAFAVGAIAGLLLRNTLAAMLVTLVLYAVLLPVVGNAVRPHYAQPVSLETEVGGRNLQGPLVPSDAWQVSYGFRDASGNHVDADPAKCGGQDHTECMRSQGAVKTYVLVHQPGRFWQFQSYELGLYLVLAAGVLGAGAWVSRRRLI